MKKPLWIAVLLIVTIFALIGVHYIILLNQPQTQNPELELQNLVALTDGNVSFNVSLSKGEQEIIESVLLNDTRYSWSDGSIEEPTIVKGETRQWNINIGSLVNGTIIDVVVEAPSGSRSDTIIVEPSSSAIDNQDGPEYVYNNYGGVGLFSEGIHVIATSQDSRTFSDEFQINNDYWKMLLENETTQASEQDFISIILSRGDKPTGGFTINVESFGWFESYPAKFLFNVNFTNPGEGIMVTEALTNPLVLIPIAKLTPGEYHIEIYITQFILNVDEEGNTYYTQILTFAPVIWKQTLTINASPDKTAGFGIFLAENDELVISEREIIEYNGSSHEIVLTQEGINKIEDLSSIVPLDGTRFVLRIKDEDIYYGWLWSPISSLPCSEVVIQTLARDNTIQIEAGYPHSNFQGEDPRSNPKVFNYFMSIGKFAE